MFDIPCELDSEISNVPAFSRITELPELEELQFTDNKRIDDRQRQSKWRSSSYGDGFTDNRRDRQRSSYGDGFTDNRRDRQRSSYGDGFTDNRRDRQRSSYGDGWRRRAPPRTAEYDSASPHSRRQDSVFGQRFSDSSYWKNQSSRQSRGSLWESEDE